MSLKPLFGFLEKIPRAAEVWRFRELPKNPWRAQSSDIPAWLLVRCLKTQNRGTTLHRKRQVSQLGTETKKAKTGGGLHNSEAQLFQTRWILALTALISEQALWTAAEVDSKFTESLHQSRRPRHFDKQLYLNLGSDAVSKIVGMPSSST